MLTLSVIGSPNRYLLIKANTIIPKLNPINLLGHIFPSNAITKYSTDFIYNQDKGIAAANNNTGYF